MKMNNNDLKKITVVKQYLLDPPASFKLYEYALVYLKDAVDILASYPEAKDTITYLESYLIYRLLSKHKFFHLSSF
jgi:hypothetical protein